MAIGFHFDDIEAAVFGYTIEEDEWGQVLVPIDKDKKDDDEDEDEIEVPPIGAPYHD